MFPPRSRGELHSSGLLAACSINSLPTFRDNLSIPSAIIKCVVIHKSADLILVPIEFGEYVMKFNESVYDTVVYRQGWLYLL
jgi:hypothetical protein